MQKPRNHRGSRRVPAGFTLMEVLLVLVILVILGSIAATAFTGAQDKALKNSAQVQVDMIKSAADRYKMDMYSYPSSLDDLMEAPSDSKKDKWAGPYLEEKVGTDPWDNEYNYQQPGKHNPNKFDVWSSGPDGVDGSDDDIGNWDAT